MWWAVPPVLYFYSIITIISSWLSLTKPVKFQSSFSQVLVAFYRNLTKCHFSYENRTEIGLSFLLSLTLDVQALSKLRFLRPAQCQFDLNYFHVQQYILAPNWLRRAHGKKFYQTVTFLVGLNMWSLISLSPSILHSSYILPRAVSLSPQLFLLYFLLIYIP